LIFPTRSGETNRTLARAQWAQALTGPLQVTTVPPSAQLALVIGTQ